MTAPANPADRLWDDWRSATGTPHLSRSCATQATTAIGRECRDGKHRNCDLDALDPVTDAITGCQCECHQRRHHDQETRR